MSTGPREICVVTKTERGTHLLGVLVGKHLVQGDFLALVGELGSGKTRLVQGIALGMDVEATAYVRSPTFVLLHTYRGRYPLFHLDCYRIKDPGELEDLDYRELFYGRGVTVVEWAEKIACYVPTEHVKILLTHKDEETREIRFVPQGSRYESMLTELQGEILNQVSCSNGSGEWLDLTYSRAW